MRRAVATVPPLVAIARVPISRLHTADWNPRSISDERFENLKRSLLADPRLLELRPILATAEGEVYAGNMRLRAAEALGWPDVPAVLEDVDERTKRERMVRDNAQWGDWDEDGLAPILAGLRDDGAAVGDLGIETGDVTRLLDSVRTTDPKADAAPSLDEAPTRAHAGDIWQLGPHRLVCGNSADSAALARLLGDTAVDLVWTDPPYGVNYVGKTADALTIENDDESGLGALLNGVFGAVSPFMRPGAAVYVAAPQGRNFAQFTDAFTAAGWMHHQTLVWVKDVFVLGHSDYHHQHEVVLYGWKGGGPSNVAGPPHEVHHV